MVHTFADYEQRPLRQTMPGDNETVYHRVYHIPLESVGSLMPSEGDDLPGETCDAVLGPYIVRGGIKYGKSPRDGVVAVLITAKTLIARSGNELMGRMIAKTADEIIYHTRWAYASATSSGMPKAKDTLSAPDYSHTNNATCTTVYPIDEYSEPGRVIVKATFVAPITYSESYL